MFTQLFQNRSKWNIRMSAFALAATALLVSSTGVSADPLCKKVQGRYMEHIVTENCTAPTGLCIAGEYQGELRGEFFGSATSLTPTADTATTGVLLFTSDSTIHARVKGKQGDLMIKNAGAFQSTGTGNIVDVQFIVGGTGDLTGASGVLRASGIFNPVTGMGESAYEGEICLP